MANRIMNENEIVYFSPKGSSPNPSSSLSLISIPTLFPNPYLSILICLSLYLYFSSLYLNPNFYLYFLTSLASVTDYVTSDTRPEGPRT